MSETTWKWDGSAIERTTALGAEWTVEDWSVDPATIITDHKRIELLDALIDNVETTLNPVRKWKLVIRADVSGISAANTRRKIDAGWEELVAAFDPTQGVKQLEATRKDASGNDVVRHLLAEITEVPSRQIRTAEPKGLAESAGYDGGYIIYVLRGQTVFPYWIDSALLDQDTSDSDAELAIGASDDTVVIDNDCARWVGLRVAVKSGSVSGSVTEFSIENGANGDVLQLKNDGPFADTDWVDYLATDPRKVSRADSATKYTGTGITRMRLEKGEQTLTGSRVAGSGSLTVSLSWPKLSLTL